MKNIELFETLETCKIHLKRAKYNHQKLQKIKIDQTLFVDEEKIMVVDAFMLRFIKLQDVMGYKLFKHLLNALGDYKPDMSMIDILDKLEKLNLLSSSDEWMSYRKKRNELTHEYPNEEKNTLEGINLAIAQFSRIEAILLKIENYVQKHKLV